MRVIAATNRDLEREVAAGRFRADLYHRLAVFPAARAAAARRDARTSPVLAAHFADAAARRLGLAGVRFTDEARLQLLMNDWPGNVRELENVIGRGVLRASFGRDRARVVELDAAHLDIRPRHPGLPVSDTGGAEALGRENQRMDGPLGDRLAKFERDAILAAVQRNGGNWAAAARDLGLHRSNLHHRARRLGLKRP